MKIISEKIDGKIEAVLYDDDGKEMMVLPKVKNSRGKEIGIDIPESNVSKWIEKGWGEKIDTKEEKATKETKELKVKRETK